MKEYDKMMLRSRKQMSETNMLMILLTISGGLQDAYSYFVRGEVFSNAQTGNIVLMSTYVAKGNWHRALHYLIPVLAFAMGIFIAERLHARFKDVGFIHWRQIIVFTEMVLLCIVGFIPLGGSYDFVANALSSCACAMQVQSFGKVFYILAAGCRPLPVVSVLSAHAVCAYAGAADCHVIGKAGRIQIPQGNVDSVDHLRHIASARAHK